MTGSFLGAFAVTLAIAVLLSMVMSLTLIPLLARLACAPRGARAKADVDDRLARAIRWLVAIAASSRPS